MAITPTPNNNIYKGLVFDDIDSRDYGIYITGEAVFNSPERDVEMIEIPGRNGTYALDKGRFHNIEVTYPAGLFGGSEADFAAGIRAFRNALASRIGYKRLEDDYNPDEYRMAVYSAGLDVTPAQLKAGEFEITFDCKPQRFLKSGETAVSVASGGTITNPTLFESSPVLTFDVTEGDVTVAINDDVVEFKNKDVGDVVITNSRTGSIFSDQGTSYPLDNLQLINVGDDITMGTFTLRLTVRKPLDGDYRMSLLSVTTLSSDGLRYVNDTGTYTDLTLIFDTTESFVMQYGTAKQKVYSISLRMVFYPSIGDYHELVVNNVNVSVTMNYRGNVSVVSLQYGYSNPNADMIAITGNYSAKETKGYSTKPTLTGTMYFDFDIGEAYRYESGELVAINDAASFGAYLPKLKTGDNTITYTGSVTNVKITPRWWEV